MTNNVHEAVQTRYGKLAGEFKESSAAACCSTNKLYNPEVISDLPETVTGLSLGCGDPVTIASIEPHETVLDLGSGAGIDCFIAARRAKHVIGVDMTPEMLEKAELNKQKLGMNHVEFRQGQIEDLPLEDNLVDVIMSNCVINLSPQKPAVFAEAFRVLKPGGRIAFSDIVTEGRFTSAQQARLDDWSQCVTGAVPVEDYRAMLAEAGFVDIEIVDKKTADDIIFEDADAPRIFSARMTAHKPL